MAVSSADVKTLREKTGAGMMDCKKALVEAGGDFKKAERILKELGLAAAAKRSGRSMNEGRIFVYINGAKAGVLELSCETDFVARNQDFIGLGESLVGQVAERQLNAPVEELNLRVQELAGKLKENISLRRVKSITASPNGFLTTYVHGEGRIGVIVNMEADKPEILANDKVKAIAFDLALHVAAFNPKYLSPENVDPAYIKEQEEIFKKQTEGLRKPEQVVQGIVKGKVNKHLSEICLLNQGFVKDEKQPVSKVLETVSKEVGSKLTVKSFIYFSVGEELE